MIRRNRLAALICVGLVGALIAVGLVVAPGQIHACSCAPLEPPTESLAKATSVFAGRVVSITERGGDDGDYPVVIEFDVSSVWKGADHQTMYLRTSSGVSTCGYRFVPGLEYLVYSPDGLRVSSCSRSRLLVGASEDLVELGEGRTPALGVVGPTPAPSAYRTGGGCHVGSASPDVSVFGAVVGVVWFRLRRRRTRGYSRVNSRMSLLAASARRRFLRDHKVSPG